MSTDDRFLPQGKQILPKICQVRPMPISAGISCKLLEELLPFITWDPKFRERKTSKQAHAFAGESGSSDLPVE